MGRGNGSAGGRVAAMGVGLWLATAAGAEESLLALEPKLEPPRPEVPARQPVSEGGDGLRKDSDEGFQVRPFGRVFARMRADEREDYSRSLSIPTARVGLSASMPYVEAEVTADLATKSVLKDAFVRVADGSRQWRLYGGQFKAPFLDRELESRWALPVVNRGLVADYLEDTHKLGGRRLGFMGELNLKEFWKLRVSGGVFEGAKDFSGTRLSEDAALRVSVSPFKRFTLGASTYLTEVFRGTRNLAIAADASLRLGALALSGEYVTGRLAVGPFQGQMALASYLLPLSTSGWGLQPVAGAELLQLTGPLKARGYGLVGGFNVLYSRHFKAQFQAEHALRPGDELAGLEYSVQLATRF